MADLSISTKESTSKKKMDVFDGVDPEVKERTKKMLMFLIVFAIVMLFGAFTSAWIVMSPQAYWVHPEPVSGLTQSCFWVAASSVFLILATIFAKQGKKNLSIGLLILTLLTGLGFTLSQWNGWQQMNDKGLFVSFNKIGDIKAVYGTDYMVTLNSVPLIYENGQFYKSSDDLRTEPVTAEMERQQDTSTSMLFLLIVVHAFHLLLGIIYLIVNIIRSIKNKINEDNVISLKAQGIYWHFMGILWVYLYLFLFIIY